MRARLFLGTACCIAFTIACGSERPDFKAETDDSADDSDSGASDDTDVNPGDNPKTDGGQADDPFNDPGPSPSGTPSDTTGAGGMSNQDGGPMSTDDPGPSGPRPSPDATDDGPDSPAPSGSVGSDAGSLQPNPGPGPGPNPGPGPADECSAGDTRDCQTGLLGACEAGEQSCTAAGVWGDCVGASPASADTCELDNDDDCSGTPNDGCDCIDGATQSCDEGGLFGKCAAGTQTCQSGKWSACDIQPSAMDTCVPGNDDNCNGNENENCPCEQGDTRPCTQAGLMGPCATGNQTCGADGTWGACSIPPAQYDGCGTADDANCDGTPNSPLDPSCQCVEGDTQCASGSPSTGYQTCTASGTWGTAQSCPFICTPGGTCGGACTPGAKQCAPNGTPQLCTNAGQWQDQAGCGMGQLCQSGTCQSCPSGSYLSGGSCVSYTPCPAGKYISQAGTSTTDQTCDDCTNGYSSTTNAPQCTPWTQCLAAKGEVVAQAGTATTNQTCKAFPSCEGLAANCGPSGNESCCASLAVEGGSFNRWNNSSAPATISDFVLDKYEITVGRFRKFKAAWDGGWTPPNTNFGKHTHLNSGDGLVRSGASGYETGWNGFWVANVQLADNILQCDEDLATWTANAGSNERRPMNCINWYTAYAFCMWDGGFLPSESEWTYAAMGGGGTNGQRQYPWSVPSTSTTISSSNAAYACTADGSSAGDCSVADMIFVGSKSAGNGYWGHADMAGNVEEWVLDQASAPQSGTCNDCIYQPSGGGTTDVMVRGGSFDAPAGFLYNTFGFSQHPAEWTERNGGRCARAP